MFSRSILIILLSGVTQWAVSQSIKQIIHQSDSLTQFKYQSGPFELKYEQLTNINRFLRYSVLTGYRPGVNPVKGIANFTNYEDTTNGTYRICMYNLSIQDMLTHGLYKSNRVILEVLDPSKYTFTGSNPKMYKEWMRNNSYCFELLLPIGIGGVDILDDELSRRFNVAFGVQVRRVPALILIRTSNKDKIKSNNKGEGYYDLKGVFQNVPINRLMHPLNEAGLPPFIDDTGYKGNIDISLNISNWSDLDQIRKELQKYDLDLISETREVEMFVITEKR